MILHEELISIFNSLFVPRRFRELRLRKSRSREEPDSVVSEFLGNQTIQVNALIGCAILRAIQTRSCAQNPLDPDVDSGGPARTTGFCQAWAELRLC
jgi:hypothetical protein